MGECIITSSDFIVTMYVFALLRIIIQRSVPPPKFEKQPIYFPVFIIHTHNKQYWYTMNGEVPRDHMHDRQNYVGGTQGIFII